MDQFNWDSDVLPLVQRRAKVRFRCDPDRETKVQDAISVAWEAVQTAPPTANPLSIAYYAVQQVVVGRHFRQSVRSLDGPPSRSRIKPQRGEFDPEDIFRPGQNPARIVAFRLDFLAWLETLTERQRAMLVALANGDRTEDVADHFGCTAGNVSQFRRRLAMSWHNFRS